jgi:hypothetical protein
MMHTGKAEDVRDAHDRGSSEAKRSRGDAAEHPSSGEVPVLRCALCSYTTVVEEGMRFHMMGHEHRSKHPFACSVCTFVTKWKSSLRQHELEHEEREFPEMQCELCPFTSRSRGSMKQHKYQHRKAYQCSVCTYTSSRRHAVMVHEGKHHGTAQAAPASAPEISAVPAPAPAPTPAPAPVAPLRIMKKRKNWVDVWAEGAHFTCDKCSYRTHWPASLEAHQRMRCDK